MRILTALLLLGLSSGCAMEEFFVGDYDDDYQDSDMVIQGRTSPGYYQAIPGGQPAQPAPAAPAVQTREPPR